MQADLARSHDCETASPAVQEQMGCKNELPKAFRFKYEGIEISRCPAFYLKNATWIQDAFQFYAWREKGILPFPGGYLDQPNKWVEACDYIDGLNAYQVRQWQIKNSR